MPRPNKKTLSGRVYDALTKPFSRAPEGALDWALAIVLGVSIGLLIAFGI